MNELDPVSTHGVLGFISHARFRERPPWHSRHHRRRTSPQTFLRHEAWRQTAAWLFAVSKLNWWIATLFSAGSLCFCAASAAQLYPHSALGQSLTQAGLVYFIGSIPFTLAAGLTLWQAANAPTPPHAPPGTQGSGRMVFPGYRPKDIGWLSAALQFLGTLLFNVSTYSGTLSTLSPPAQTLWIWVPNFAGSVLFLASGTLAYLEVTHAWLTLKPSDLSWWVVAINLLGCIGFMVSALAACPTFSASPEAAVWATATTLQGALCFLVGSLLMLPESANTRSPGTDSIDA